MRTAVLLGICLLLVCVSLVPAGPWIPGATGRGYSAGEPEYPSGDVLEVGTSPTCAYHTIADAMAAAQPGDTIKVQAATFVEPALVVDRDLTLAGGYHSADPYGCLTLTGVGYTTYQRSGTTAAPAILVQNAALTVTWFIVELNAYGSGVQVVDGEATLEDVIVRDNEATPEGTRRAAGCAPCGRG